MQPNRRRRIGMLPVSNTLLTAYLLIVFATVANRAFAQCVQQELEPNDTCPVNPFDLASLEEPCTASFGVPVALDRDTLVIGAIESRPNEASEALRADAYSAFVFRRVDSEWLQVAKLSADDAQPIALEIGSFVSVSGDRVVLGSRHDPVDTESSIGSVYVFRRDGETWSKESKLVPSDAAAAQGLLFGASVSISGEVIAVGAPAAEDAGTFSGAVYVFTRSGTTWVEVAKLVPSDLTRFAGFGLIVAAAGDRIVASGEYRHSEQDGDETVTGSSGVVYVFRRDGTNWVQEARLTGAEPSAFDDTFGDSISLFGTERIAIGDPRGDIRAAVYFFAREAGSWALENKITAIDTGAGPLFGSSVSLDDMSAVIGDPSSGNRFPAQPGAAYVFHRSGTNWTHTATLVSPHDDIRFGFSDVGSGVAAASNSVFVGEYIFDLTEANCQPATPPDDAPSEDGPDSPPFGTGVRPCGAGAVIAIPLMFMMATFLRTPRRSEQRNERDI